MDQYRKAAYQVLEAADLPRVDRVIRQRVGIANKVFKAGDFVVKLGAGSDGRHFAKSASILQAIEGGIKSNRLVYLDDTHVTFPWPVMVVTWLPGKPLCQYWSKLDATQKKLRLVLVLDEMKKLHQVDTTTIAHFSGSKPWVERRNQEFLEFGQQALEDPVTSKEIVQSMMAFWTENQPVFLRSPPEVLVHEDINLTNVLFDADRLTGIIDFDDADLCPAEIDYWQMASALTDGPEGLDTAAAKRLFGGFHAFKGEEAYLRCKLEACYWVLRQMVERVSWQTRKQTLQDAREDYDFVFLQNGLRKWFQ